MKMYLIVKRIFDFCVALFAIIVTSPIWLITIIGIELSDPGPIFFRAARIGYQGKEFTMWKFRSMRVARKETEKSEASFKADTNRIFPFGALIRRLKIDELPQFINVLDGTMSVVGPRPASPDQVMVMREGRYAIANTVKPGVTGPAALYDYIFGDVVEELDEYERLVLPTRRELEAYYPLHMGPVYDIKMIWYTVVCVVASVFGKKPKKIFDELVSCVEAEEFLELQEEATV